MPATAGLDLEVSFMGSLHALEEFAAGRAEIAGFHVPIGGRPAFDRSPFLRALRCAARTGWCASSIATRG